MRNFLAVFTKEIKSYFVSPVAYVIAAVSLVLCGYMFRQIMMQFNQVCMIYTQQMRYGGGIPNLNVNEFVVMQFFGVMYFIWLLLVPMLTMRLYSEERKGRTMELLMTSPITTMQTLLGKYFACFGLCTGIVALTFLYPILLEAYGDPAWGPIVSAYAGFLMMGGAFISVGVFASALTENQIVAAVISFCILLLFWLIDWAASFAGPTVAKVLTYLSIIEHIRDFSRGMVDTRDVVFYLTFIFFMLFLTHTVIESKRWRA